MDDRIIIRDKPKINAIVYLLVVVMGAGIASLWFSAYHAFSLVMSPSQAMLTASAIELAVVAEAVLFVGGNKKAGWAMVTNMAISMGYNWYIISIEATTPPFMTVLLAVGLVPSVMMTAFTIGEERRKHLAAVSAWELEFVDEKKKEDRNRRRRESRSSSKPVSNNASKPVSKPVSNTVSSGHPAVASNNDRRTVSEQDVLEYFVSNPEHGLREAASTLGASKSTVGNRVASLKKAGLLDKIGNSWVAAVSGD